jgi:hypothetical protein
MILEMRNVYNTFIAKSQGKWVDSVYVFFRIESVVGLMQTAMNLWVPGRGGNFFTS